MRKIIFLLIINGFRLNESGDSLYFEYFNLKPDNQEKNRLSRYYIRVKPGYY